MTDIFTKKDSWIEFANHHNNKTTIGAVSLTGAASYTLAVKYVAAGLPIPLSVRLDTTRKKGVADHFKGLREYLDSGYEANNWIKRVAKECRDFAIDNSINVDKLMLRVLELTEKGSQHAKSDNEKQTTARF